MLARIGGSDRASQDLMWKRKRKRKPRTQTEAEVTGRARGSRSGSRGGAGRVEAPYVQRRSVWATTGGRAPGITTAGVAALVCRSPVGSGDCPIQLKVANVERGELPLAR